MPSPAATSACVIWQSLMRKMMFGSNPASRQRRSIMRKLGLSGPKSGSSQSSPAQVAKGEPLPAQPMAARHDDVARIIEERVHVEPFADRRVDLGIRERDAEIELAGAEGANERRGHADLRERDARPPGDPS